jgi:Tfp pilus assembly protein PilZ
MPEKRLQRRVGIEIPIQVYQPGSDAAIVARYQDLSWGGACFVTSDFSIQDGHRLIMHFPWTNGQSFVIEADVVRCEPLESGSQQVAVRFATVGHRDDRRLAKLIELLSPNLHEASPATGTPTMPMLELILDDPEEMRDKLSQIAEGYLFITAFGAYRVGQSLLLLIEHTDDFPGLRLRTRVKSQSVDDQADSDLPCLVTLELEFEHPRDELRKLAQLSMHFRSKKARFIGPYPDA